MPDTNPLYSHHIFLFPFKWDYLSNDTALSATAFTERTNLNTLKSIFQNRGGDSNSINQNWKDFPFAINQPTDYNEWTYFYDNVRPVLFDSENSRKTAQPLLLQYHIKDDIGEDGKKKTISKYIITLKEANKATQQSKYDLELEEITINFYATGIGVIAFHLNNRTYPAPEDILYINEFGRRLFPQFLTKNAGNEVTLDAVKGAFLADKITLKIANNEPIEETFSGFSDLKNLAKQPFQLPKFIQNLLPNAFKTDKAQVKKGDVLLSPQVDDRMFVMCWYANDDKIKALQDNSSENMPYSPQYLTNEFWYSFIFIDKETPSVKNPKMQSELIEKHTYARWLGDNQLYGMSRYSFVLLTDKGRSYLLPHIQTMYFQIVMLCLVQRISVLRFSEEVSQIVANNAVQQVQTLYQSYIDFINKIYFREVTPQEQGIEIYDKLQDIMRIEKHVKELDTEIQELHNYMSLKEDERRNNLLDKITKIGAFLGISGLIISFFGMNYFGADENALQLGQGKTAWGNPALWSVIWIGVISVGISALIGLIWYLFNLLRIKKNRKS